MPVRQMAQDLVGDMPPASPTEASLDEKEEMEKIERVPVVAELIANHALGNIPSPPCEMSPEMEKRLYRKVDLWLMPILALMYLCAFIDRGICCRALCPVSNDVHHFSQGILVSILFPAPVLT